MKRVTLLPLLLLAIIACTKTELPVQDSQDISSTPSVNALNKNLTITTFNIGANSAIQAGARSEISVAGGGASIVEAGFCYNTSPGATLDDDTVHATPSSFFENQYNAMISGLSPGTTYYVKAYGKKNNGDVYYGNEVSFTTLTLGMPTPGIGPVTDIDGNVYNTITLGTQVWMVENLRTTKYNDGTPIPNITDNAAWAAATSGAYSDYNNNPANSADYGRIYNLYAAKDPRKIAPAGWHIPNISEWVTLLNYLGGAGVAGGRMKEAGFNHWLTPNTGADNSSLFAARGGGGRSVFSVSGTFTGLLSRANYWSSSSVIYPGSVTLNIFYLNYNTAGHSMSYGGSSLSAATFGCSVRCIKD